MAPGDGRVIASGGGTVLYPKNVELFHQGGSVILYLDVPLAALQERLKNDKRRPLLQVPDRRQVIARLYRQRCPQYRAAADRVIDAGAPAIVVAKRIAPPCGSRGRRRPQAEKCLDKTAGPVVN